jgi:hypothetical protein
LPLLLLPQQRLLPTLGRCCAYRGRQTVLLLLLLQGWQAAAGCRCYCHFCLSYRSLELTVLY